MKFLVYSAFLLCLLFTASIHVKAQSQTLTGLQTTLETLAENFPQEKIYIHFDKPSYAPGETIWFKGYIMAGADPSEVSKTLYVDFVTAEGRTVRHCVIPILQAGAAGNYDLPLDFKNEYLYVKAYTKWMLNFDSSFLYRKTLHVIQQKPVARKRAVPTQKTAIQFLPEGGNFVENVEATIAFKALRFDGRPAPVSGAVFDNNNVKVADINTLHDGMGTFTLTAKSGETYTARWKDDLNNNYETKLPAAKPSGVTLKIKVQPNTRSFTIQRSENAPANLHKLYIVATMQQHLVYGAGVNLAQVPVTGGSIPVSGLPSGILQVTLFDSNWMAVAERITFINNNNYAIEPEVGFAQLGTDKRKQNTLVIHTDSVTANFSVAVTDAGIGIDSSDDILSRLLLTGDLKGEVYHPYYYFKNNDISLQQQLDLVMLTNGWRRINWDNVLNEKFQQIKYPNEPDYLSLSGKLFGPSEQDLKKGGIILMIVKNNLDTANRVLQTVVDGSGQFVNPDIILYDTSKVYYRVSGNENFAKSTVVNFNSSQSAPRVIATDTAANAFFADTATENYKRRLAQQQMLNFKMQQGTTLEDVVVKTKTKSPTQVLDEKYASPLFSSGDSYPFDVVNDPFARSAMNVLQYLQGKVAGLTISSAGGGGGNSSVTWRGGTPTFFMNEMQVDINTLSSISMSDVAYVKVFRPPFIGAVGGGSSGAIAVYTRKGGEVDARPDNSGGGLPYKMVIGYTTDKEFYSPDYASINQRNEEQDLRTTLYWSPMVLTTPANNTIKLKFFNNDFSHGFRVVLEGITADGKLARIEKLIE